MRINYVVKDILDVPQGYYLAHSISGDMTLGAGVAKQLDVAFNLRRKLKNMYSTLNVGDAYVVDNVFNLVSKKTRYDRVNLDTLEQCFEALRKYMEQNEIYKLAIPKIGNGHDHLDWNRVEESLIDVFSYSDVQILVCVLSEEDLGEDFDEDGDFDEEEDEDCDSESLCGDFCTQSCDDCKCKEGCAPPTSDSAVESVKTDAPFDLCAECTSCGECTVEDPVDGCKWCNTCESKDDCFNNDSVPKLLCVPDDECIWYDGAFIAISCTYMKKHFSDGVPNTITVMNEKRKKITNMVLRMTTTMYYYYEVTESSDDNLSE